MKKVLPILALALFAFAGCQKTTSTKPDLIIEPVTNAIRIVGKWHFAADTIKIYENTKLRSSYSALPAASAYVQFNVGGTGESNNPTAYNFTYSIKNEDQLTMNIPPMVVSGQNLPATSTVSTIKYITDNKMLLYFDQSTTDNGVSLHSIELIYFTK